MHRAHVATVPWMAGLSLCGRATACLALVACSGGGASADAGTDAEHGWKAVGGFDASVDVAPGVDCNAGNVPSTTYPGPHPAMLQIVSSGGPVLAQPRFVPFVFQGEDRLADIAAFTQALGTSTYWTGTAAQYGIGPATASPPTVVDQVPPSMLTDGDVATWLGTQITTPDSNAIYIVYYPATTTITTAWAISCSGLYGFAGYHSQTTIAGVPVVYAVIARCPMSNITMTGITSHELFEAASDPYIYTAPAYMAPPGAFGVDEIGDLCESTAPVVPSDIGYPVQRIWSNDASAAGRQPCVPTDGQPFFQTLPSNLPPTNAKLSLAPGAETTIELLAFSDMPAGPWNVTVQSSQAYLSDAPGLTLCRTTAMNGESIPFTISRPSVATDDSIVTITSTLADASTNYTFTVGD